MSIGQERGPGHRLGQDSETAGSWRAALREILRVAGEPAEWRGLGRRIYAASPRYLLSAAGFIYQNFSSFVSRCLWATAGLVIVVIVFQGLTQRVTVIEPIAVPKTLMERGYSPDVAALRLRDAMIKFVSSVNTRMRQPEVALHAELPNIVVPTVGISLDAVMSSIRTLLRSTRSQSIGGEFTIVNNQLWLRLRLNNIEFYSSKEGGDPEKPEDLLVAAVPEAMKKTQPYFVAAWLYGNNDPDNALELVNWITATLPESNENVVWAYSLKGIVLRERKDYQAAEEALHKALALNGQLATAHINLCAVWEETGKIADAIAECREAIRLDPKHPAAHSNLGNSLLSAGKGDQAIAEYREAIKLDPKNAMPHIGIGNVLKAAGKNDEAIAEYREAIKVDPKKASPHNALANTLASAGKDDEAIAEYREAIRLDPRDAVPHYNLGIRLASAGSRDEAIAEYREAIRLDPNDASPHNGLGNSLRSTGRSDEAIAEYRIAIRLNPKYALAHSNLGLALYAGGKVDEAVVEYREAIRLDPKFSNPHVYLGYALREAGKGDQAITEYREAIRLDPKNARAHTNLGLALDDAGEAADAMAEFRRVLEIEPNNETALDYLKDHSTAQR
jgi:tetratricopeptide (TPR) repeat protein